MNFKPLSVLLLLFCGFVSCKEIIEPSLTKKVINPLAPGEKYQSTSYTINFWWDEIEDADHYRLQVVTPGFDTIGALIADTAVRSNKFALSVSPGQYQWRVRAENSSSSSAFSANRSFSVAASSIKQQKVILNSPANDGLTNQSPATFKWTELFGATKYRFQIDTNNFANELQVMTNQTIPAQQYTFDFPKDKQYQWRVRAENDTAQSLWSEIRIISFDHTPPGQVTLSSPADIQTVPLPITLQWAALTGSSKYKLYVFKSDGATPFNPSFPTLTTATSYAFNLGVSGDKVYWKVSAVDAAGNEGPASSLRSFVIQ